MKIDAIIATNLYSANYKLKGTLHERMYKVRDILEKEFKEVTLHPDNMQDLDGVVMWQTLDAILEQKNDRLNLVNTSFAKHLSKALIDVELEHFKDIQGLHMFQFHDSFSMKSEAMCQTMKIQRPFNVRAIYTLKKGDDLLILAAFHGTLHTYMFIIPCYEQSHYSKVSEVIEHYIDRSAATDNQLNLLRFACNLLLYVTTGDPNLTADNKKGLSKSQIKKLGARANLLPFKMTKVGYSTKYKFLEKSVNVRGHFRWQPCGTGRKSVKLIWIKPFQKKLGV